MRSALVPPVSALAALTALVTLAVAPPAFAENHAVTGPITILINEVDADTPGTDVAEFVELYDGGAGNTSLTGYVLVLYNGNGDVSYQAFDLDGLSTDGDGYFVLCGNAANVANCDLDVTPDSDLVQNGPDAVALYQDDATSFPNGTAVTLTNLVDALVYDTNDGDDAGLLVLLNAAQPQVNEGENGASATESNQRCPNGSGGARNTSTYAQYEPTPGAANTCGVTAPTISIADASVLEGDVGTVNLVLTVTVDPPAAGAVTFDIDTADGTATVGDGDYDAQSLDGQSISPGGSYQLSVVIHGDSDPELDETFTVTLTNVSGALEGDLVATATILNDDGVLVTPIHDIQGSGATSPLVGVSVTTTGIVTGLKSNGFFLQAADADADMDPTTSEGIFVFTSSAPTVAVGDELQVTGTVSEFSPPSDSEQPPVTELGAPLTISSPISTGNVLPAPVPLTTSLPDPAGAYDQLERLEFMRVSVGSLAVVAPTLGSLTETTGAANSNGTFYGVVAGTPRPLREAGVQLPDDLATILGGAPPANIPRFDTNPERIRVDSDALGNVLVDVRAGATVAGLVGPLDYAFRTFSLLPDAGAVLVPSGGATPTAASTPTDGEITVASYNFERFFDDVDDPGVGDPVATTVYYQARLEKASRHVRNYLHFPDILGAVEVEKLAVLEALAAQISTDAIGAAQPDPQYAAYLVEGNDIGGIDVGFLVKTAPVNGPTPRVEVLGVTQEGAATTWIDPSDNAPHLLNDRPPLVLEAVVHHANGSEMPLTVVVVHQRSLNGIASTSVDGLTTTGNRVRQKRRAQAEFLANLIQTRQTNDPSEPLVAVGDYNAFEVNDGFVDATGTVMGTPTPADQVALASADLVTPDLVRLADSDDYSFLFDGNAQNLDHALVNAALVAATSARRLDHARVNADFANVDAADPVARMADHDPLLAYLEVAAFADTDALFRDDFESGAVCRWSSATGAPSCAN
ncbi:MAG: nuclease [Acidobacteria bacterium]|nr:nuclease [Acidobacteriota bacterium]